MLIVCNTCLYHVQLILIMYGTQRQPTLQVDGIQLYRPRTLHADHVPNTYRPSTFNVDHVSSIQQDQSQLKPFSKKRFCFAFFVSIFVCFIFFSPYRKLKCYQYWGSDQGSVSSSGQNVIYQVKNLSENCDVEADRISVS